VRDAFVGELTKLAANNPKIVLIVGDLGFGVIEPFRDQFPDRFFNAGVAEQNMMSMSAGLASEGFHVFAYSIANFSTFRCAEQIRNDVDYHNLPVTIVAVGGGLAYGNLGYSHHAIQDFALLRSFPNMLIAAPGDPMETIACTRFLAAHPQPSFLRLGRGKDQRIHDEVPTVMPGVWNPVFCPEESRDVLLTTGGSLRYIANDLAAMSSNSKGARQGHPVSLYSMPLWGPQHRQVQATEVARWDSVKTVEDHVIDGGFGSWMLESLALHAPDQLSKVSLAALPAEICGVVGSQDELMQRAGLASIADLYGK
jgi:transketolase